MRTTVVSYTHTGKNETLATSIAAELSAQHIRITEPRRRTHLTITLDLLFRRAPRVELSPNSVETNGLVVFVAPVWMGQIAFPLRTCLRGLKGRLNRYAFVSLSGGGDGPDSNPNLARELEKRVGKKPLAVINLHIADLVTSDDKPTPQEIEDYRLSESDVKALTDKAVKTLQQLW